MDRRTGQGRTEKRRETIRDGTRIKQESIKFRQKVIDKDRYINGRDRKRWKETNKDRKRQRGKERTTYTNYNGQTHADRRTETENEGKIGDFRKADRARERDKDKDVEDGQMEK